MIRTTSKTFCSITYPDGMGHNTEALSLFQAAAIERGPPKRKSGSGSV
jgi:hypothetical protein